MNRSFSLILLFPLGLMLMATSCKDKATQQSYCQENPGDCQSVLVAKEFFLFKEGSWWVYEEETSLERDSVYVYEYYDSGGYDFDMRVHSSLSDYNYHYWPIYAAGNQSCSQSAPVQGKCLLIKCSKGKSGDYIGEGNCFFVNFRVGDYETTYNIVYPNNKIAIDDIQSTYSTLNFTFGKTVKVNELNTFIEGKQPTNHYYAKTVGLIRRELLDSNQVWNLVSYHIEP